MSFWIFPKNSTLRLLQVDFRREAPNLFSREVFCPSPLCCRRHIGKRADPADKVGHFMWTYIETLRRCRSDFDFKLVSSKISFLLAH